MKNKILEGLKSAVISICLMTGITICGFLTWISVGRHSVPCGSSPSCSVVLASSYSKVFGVPIAACGLISYLGLLGFSFQPLRNRNQLTILSTLSTLASIGLTLIALTIIRATCPYCIASLVCLSILTMMFSSKHVPKQDILSLVGASILNIAWLQVAVNEVRNGELEIPYDSSKLSQLSSSQIKKNAVVFGSGDGIILFVDFQCEACHQHFMNLARSGLGQRFAAYVLLFPARFHPGSVSLSPKIMAMNEPERSRILFKLLSEPVRTDEQLANLAGKLPKVDPRIASAGEGSIRTAQFFGALISLKSTPSTIIVKGTKLTETSNSRALPIILSTQH